MGDGIGETAGVSLLRFHFEERIKNRKKKKKKKKTQGRPGGNEHASRLGFYFFFFFSLLDKMGSVGEMVRGGEMEREAIKTHS